MESEREIEQSNGMQQVERERKSSLVDAPQLDLTLAHRKRTKLAADHLSLFRRSNRNFELLLSSNNAHLLTQANKHRQFKEKESRKGNESFEK